MPIYSADPPISNFQPYTQHKMSDTINTSAPNARNTESAEILAAMHDALDYGSYDDAFSGNETRLIEQFWFLRDW